MFVKPSLSRRLRRWKLMVVVERFSWSAISFVDLPSLIKDAILISWGVSTLPRFERLRRNGEAISVNPDEIRSISWRPSGF